MAGQDHLGVFVEQGAQKLVVQTDPEDKAAVFSLGDDVVIMQGDGAPTDGSTGADVAGPGSIYIDRTNAVMYMNTGTKALPYWFVVGNQAT